MLHEVKWAHLIRKKRQSDGFLDVFTRQNLKIGVRDGFKDTLRNAHKLRNKICYSKINKIVFVYNTYVQDLIQKRLMLLKLRKNIYKHYKIIQFNFIYKKVEVIVTALIMLHWTTIAY